jgi:hypothetical protein
MNPYTWFTAVSVLSAAWLSICSRYPLDPRGYVVACGFSGILGAGTAYATLSLFPKIYNKGWFFSVFVASGGLALVGLAGMIFLDWSSKIVAAYIMALCGMNLWRLQHGRNRLEKIRALVLDWLPGSTTASSSYYASEIEDHVGFTPTKAELELVAEYSPQGWRGEVVVDPPGSTPRLVYKRRQGA